MISFLQDDTGWEVLGAGGYRLGRISEVEGGYSLDLTGHGPAETFPDVTDAQGRALDIVSPGWRDEDERARESIEDDADRRAGMARADAGLESAARRLQASTPRRDAPWKGGPKRFTKFARAVSIKESIRTYGSIGGGSGFDNRDRSPAHAQAHELASQAADHLSTAQDLSGVASAHRHEMRHRSRGARLLAKAEALMPEVRKVDALHTDALLAGITVERDEPPGGFPTP